ncbi:basic amino acid/polyamine antiporter [Rhodococcus sp. X156]|uniref:basic amino acid/polyamine antiporter n=1 Tax=Rhodococcus sp. X156 TaxID=2499145 RepID=UPI000FD8E2A7|nr:basic amino acid/polyamine antiporter [Rhodococcus sp. X156]
MASTETTVARTPTLSMLTLTALVVGSMVGAGVFSLPGRFASETGVAGALIVWGIAGSGTLMLALVFQNLAMRKPELDAGVYAYAKAGFGEYLGFFSAFGYWASACVGNVTYWVLMTSTAGAVFPGLGSGDTPLAVAVSSAGVWVFYLLVRRGVREAAAINRAVTVAKLVPIVVFVLLALFVLDPQVFVDNWSGSGGLGTLPEQVRATMLVTVFVFLGVEGASVYSRHARRRKDVGRATVLGFLVVLSIFASVTIVSYGVLPAAEIAALRQPTMAGILEEATGEWGAVFISVGLLVAVLGAYLAWTLMAAEVLYVAAADHDMPRFLGRANTAGVPGPALLMSTLLAQVVLLLTMFSEDAFTFALNLTSALVLVPLLLAAAYALKLAVTRETYTERPQGHAREYAVSALATLYVTFLLSAAGVDLLLLSFIVYACSTLLFVMVRREQGRRVFAPRELVIFGISLLGAAAGVAGLVMGWIDL